MYNNVGGLIPFLAVMRHPNARSLLPSQWKEHVLPHVKRIGNIHVYNYVCPINSIILHAYAAPQEKFTPHYVMDLLHHLLGGTNDVIILKINPGGYILDLIPALEILTTIFDNLKDSEG